jgi:5-methylcytosine-specific restriction endonuclease McrA
MSPCSVVECSKPVFSSGLCSMHKARLSRHGDVSITLRNRLPFKALKPGVCAVGGCEKPTHRSALCRMHGARFSRHQDVNYTDRPSCKDKPCTVDGCDGLQHGSGLCSVHRQRLAKHGSLELPRRICAWCGETVKWSKGQKRFCSRECRVKHYFTKGNGRFNNRASTLRRRAAKVTPASELINPRDIYARDKWTCQLCQRRMNKRLRYPHSLSASIDHIVPLSKGGSHTWSNIQAAHLTCNLKKHTKSLGQLRLAV